MSDFARLAEQRITEAIEAGEFAALPGEGAPLDLDAYFSAPPSLRAGLGLLKSSGVAPPEVDALREIAQLRARLEAPLPPAEAAAIRREVALRETSLAVAFEKMRGIRRAEGLGI